MNNKRLGRGLDALFNPVEVGTSETVREISVEKLRPNPYQPRKHFDDDALAELTESVKQYGIVQPLIVREAIKGYEIVAGERRFRSAKLAGLDAVPVVVRDLDDDQMMEIGLIENLQREDLNPLEVATAYKKLMDHFQLTQEVLADRVGKSRPHVTNFMRLLQLPQALQEDVSRGTLSMGHARALISVRDVELQKKLANRAKEQGASVRQLEEWIQLLNNRIPKSKIKKPAPVHPNIRHYEGLLQQVFSTPVKIRPGKKKGKIEIEYFSDRELSRLIEMIQQGHLIN